PATPSGTAAAAPRAAEYRAPRARGDRSRASAGTVAAAQGIAPFARRQDPADDAAEDVADQLVVGKAAALPLIAGVPEFVARAFEFGPLLRKVDRGAAGLLHLLVASCHRLPDFLQAPDDALVLGRGGLHRIL